MSEKTMTRREFNKVLASLGALSLSGLTACGAGGSSTDGGSGSAVQSLSFNLSAEPSTASSLLATDLTSYNVIRPTFCGLLRLDEDNNVVPELAESYDVSDDMLTYTFHLRSSQWANGDPLTAGDFEFAWKQLLNPTYGAPYSYLFYDIAGAQEYNSGSGDESAVGIKATDDSTLVVNLVNPIPYFPFLCTQPPFFPVKESFFEDCEAKGDNTYASSADNLLCNGPFKMVSWDHNSQIQLEKNPNYWDADSVKLDSVTLMMVTEATTEYNMFTAGELDQCPLGTASVRQQAKDAGYDITEYGTGAVFYVMFNLASGPLANKHIRQALSYAINRDSLINDVFQSSDDIALGFTPPEIKTPDGQDFHSLVGDCFKDNDAEGAKAALEAGLSELGLTELPTLEVLISESESDRTQAAALQSDWKSTLGVDAEINTQPNKAKIAAIDSGDFQICFTGWGPDYDDPMTYLDVFTSDSGLNTGAYKSDEYDSLVELAKTTTDQDERTDAMVKAEKILMDDMPIAPLYISNSSEIVSDNLSGWYGKIFQGFNYYRAEKTA